MIDWSAACSQAEGREMSKLTARLTKRINVAVLYDG